MSAKPPLPDDLWVKIPADAKAAILSLVDSFERRIAALEARLNRNSSNSSKPPSTEPIHVKRQPPRPASKRRRGGQVCRKILEAEVHLWRFAEVEGVAPDNNAAERALRHGVIWRKLSLGTASEAGSRFVERLLSVVETCRQRGRSVASYLTACFQAKRGGEPIPSPLA